MFCTNCRCPLYLRNSILINKDLEVPLTNNSSGLEIINNVKTFLII